MNEGPKGSRSKFGNLVLIDHGGGFVSVYAHLRDISVKSGQHVNKGERIGWAGKSGQVESPQLHFEIRRHSVPLDPRDIIPEPPTK
jgi:murein DD-endopeptidase MepM/ murein hydrolase activator NlpD